MRLPVPTRFDPKYAFIFIVFVFFGQSICGSDLLYTILTCTYIGLWTLGFNLAGGLVYPSGAFIFFNGFLSVVISAVFKIGFFEPAEKNLHAPILMMEVYCVGMVGMIFAAFLCRTLRPPVGLLKDFDSLSQMKTAAIVCFILGYLPDVLGLGRSSGSLYSALAQINHLPMLGVMLATAYEIKRSGGKRSVNWIVMASGGAAFALALTYFGKAGMLVGLMAWLVAGVMFRYSFSKAQIVGLIIGFSFFNYYLVPYSQLVRTYHQPTFAENEAVALSFLSDLNATRQQYLDSREQYDDEGDWHLFDSRPPFLERLIILGADDTLINFTGSEHFVGLSPTTNSYINFIPHFIWKDKPAFNIGNDYAHELPGVLDDDDTTTGVSFGPTADFYHQAGWFGVLVVWPMVLFLFFVITDSLTGSAHSAPWALLPILTLSQAANGGGVAGVVYQTTYGTLELLVTYFVLMHGTPFVINLFRRSSRRPQQALPSAASPVLDAL